MTTKVTGSWTLFEFVGGPRDGELCACSSVELDNVLQDYLLRTNPLHLSDGPSWHEAAQRAVSAFDQGSPNGYARLLWEGESFVAPADSRGTLVSQIVSQRDRLEHALIAGQLHEARLITSAFCAHTPSKTALIDSLLAPAMRSIGSRWAAGEIRVYVERRASAIVHSILGDHSAASAHVAGLRATVATLADEAHSLPARMAAVALREDGWQVEELAGPIPQHELIESAIERRLDLVVISSTIGSVDAITRSTTQQLEPHGIAVLVGRPGQSVAELQRLARRISLSLTTG